MKDAADKSYHVEKSCKNFHFNRNGCRNCDIYGNSGSICLVCRENFCRSVGGGDCGGTAFLDGFMALEGGGSGKDFVRFLCGRGRRDFVRWGGNGFAGEYQTGA